MAPAATSISMFMAIKSCSRTRLPFPPSFGITLTTRVRLSRSPGRRRRAERPISVTWRRPKWRRSFSDASSRIFQLDACAAHSRRGLQCGHAGRHSSACGPGAFAANRSSHECSTCNRIGQVVDWQRYGSRAHGPAALGWRPESRGRLYRIRLLERQGSQHLSDGFMDGIALAKHSRRDSRLRPRRRGWTHTRSFRSST